jgi:DNA-binding NarL/FixJ family response regulator
LDIASFRVLLVDDMAGLRQLVRMTLESSDHFIIVGEAGDGVEAIEQARDLTPDLVLLDLSMPRMDGLEALPLILDASPRSKVIVLTGFESERISSKAVSRGAIACLEKGITPVELVDSLLDLLEAKPLRDSG